MRYARLTFQPQPARRVESERNMTKRQSKANPTWEEVKAKLAGFDRAALLAVLQDLYAVAEGNRAFLHPRFGLGQDPLPAYKKIIDRWLWPDAFRGEQTSVSRAKKAISDYKRASGDPEGLAELMVYYCVRMFEQALRTTTALAANSGAVRNRLLGTLDQVRTICHGLGYVVRDDMDVLFAEIVLSSRRRVFHGHR